jgi:hypothetical protein
MKIRGPFSFRHGAPRGFEREPAAERIARKSATYGSAEGGRAGQEGEGLAGRSLMANPPFGTILRSSSQTHLRDLGATDGKPFRAKDALRSPHAGVPFRQGRRRANLLNIGDLNASPPTTDETLDRRGPLHRESVGEMSATYWSASGERAGREGGPTPGQSALPGVPRNE